MIEIKSYYVVNEYKKYLKKDFPDSKLLKEYENSRLKKCIKKLFLTVQLIELYVDHEKIGDSVKTSLDTLRDYLLRYIYVLPLGDNFFYNAIVRRISEIILRSYILLFDSQKTYPYVCGLGYRNIKKELNSYPESLCPVFSKSLLFFKEQFSHGSNILHGTIDVYEIDYLYSTQRDNLCANIKDIERFTNNVLYLLTDVIKINYNLKETDFSLSQISIIKGIESILD